MAKNKINYPWNQSILVTWSQSIYTSSQNSSSVHRILPD